MKPRVPITSPEFKYDNAVSTNIGKRFEAIRKAQQVTLTQSISDRAAVERHFADRRRIEAEEAGLRG